MFSGLKEAVDLAIRLIESVREVWYWELVYKNVLLLLQFTLHNAMFYGFMLYFTYKVGPALKAMAVELVSSRATYCESAIQLLYESLIGRRWGSLTKDDVSKVVEEALDLKRRNIRLEASVKTLTEELEELRSRAFKGGKLVAGSDSVDK